MENPYKEKREKWEKKFSDAVLEDIKRKLEDEPDYVPAAYSMLFFNGSANDPQERYSWTIRIANDPTNPHSAEEKARMEESINMIMQQVAKMLYLDELKKRQIEQVEKREALEEFSARGKF